MPSVQTDPKDLYLAYRFQLKVGSGDLAGYFTECSGLGLKVPAILYREGGLPPNQVHRLPSWTQYSDVTLRYGLTDKYSQNLWKWLKVTMTGVEEDQPLRQNVTITMLKVDGSPGISWNLTNAWPSEWRAAPLDALGQEVAIESLTLVFDYLEKAN